MNNMKWLVSILILVLFHTLIMGGNEHPHFQKGGASGLTENIDSVNLQNGNAVLKIPLGPAYDLGPVMSFQTHLYYNSKLWQSADTRQWTRLLEGENITKPSTSANAGIGFSVNPPGGKLLGNSPIYNGVPNDNNTFWTWLYVDADGGSHYLYPDQREGQLNDGYFYSWDGSNIRAYISESSKYVELPNGVKITFFNAMDYHNVLATPRDEAVFWPSRIEDRFETPNFLEFDYSPIDGGGFFDITINDRLNREWVFSFRRIKYNTGVLDTLVADQNYNVAFQIQNISMPGYNGTQVDYSFTYEDLLLAPTCSYKQFADVDNQDLQIKGDFEMLKKVTLPDPDGDSATIDRPFYEFEYFDWSSTNYSECKHGVLSTIVLPTRGTIHWDFELLIPQSFCAFRDGDPGATDPWFPGRTPWIISREYKDQGVSSGAWSYQYVFSRATPNSPGDQPPMHHLDETCSDAEDGNDNNIDRFFTNETIMTRETDSQGNRHYYFFNNWDYTHDSFQTGHERAAPHAQNWTDYLLPYLKSTKIPFADGFRSNEHHELFLTPEFLDAENLICDNPLDGDCTTDAGERYLSSVHFKKVGEYTGDCEPNSENFEFCTNGEIFRLERTEFVDYEVERNQLLVQSGLPPQDMTAVLGPGTRPALPFAGDKRARLVSTRTVLYNNRTDPNWEIETEYSNFDHFNNPKKTFVKEIGHAGQEYTTYFDYIDNIANHEAEADPNNRAPWIVGLYRHRWTQEASKRFKTETLFNANTGVLERSRIYADTSTDNNRGLKDVLEAHEYSASGRLLRTKNYGGDIQGGISETQSVGDINLTALTPEYETEFGYDDNNYLISETLHGRTQENAVVSLVRYQNELDKNTGKLISSRDVSEVLTTYDYDLLCRITSVNRLPDFGETYDYQFYPLASETNQFRRVVADLPEGTKTTKIFIDGLGRDVRIETDFPDGKKSNVKHEYTSGGDANGFLNRSSLPYYPGAENIHWSTITTRNFDGTPDGVKGPDGQTQFSSRRGLRLNQWSGPVPERKWKELDFDFRGRIISAKIKTTPCAPDPNCPDPCNSPCGEECIFLHAAFCEGTTPAQSLDRTPFRYNYDAGGNLGQVSLFGTSLRSWTYDGRGFLNRESRFDKADVASDLSQLVRTDITYGGYDSLGNPGWMLEQKDAEGRWDGESARKTIYAYDPLGRLHTVETEITGGLNPGRTLVEETNYYWANSGDNLGKGKVESVKRVNFVTPEDDPVPVTITELYTYAGGRGRVSKTTTAINQTNPGSGILLEQDYRYNQAGQLIGYDYPHFVQGVQAERETQRSLSLSYDKLHLTNIEMSLDGGQAESFFDTTSSPKIQYHANGVPEYTHWANGVESFYQLYKGTSAPSEIRVTGASNYYHASPYRYDEAGNILQKGGRHYTYDSANRLISADLGGTKRYYWYTKFGAIEKIDEEAGGIRSTILDLVGNYWGDLRIANAKYDPWGNMTQTPVPNSNNEFYYYDGVDMPRKRIQQINASADPGAQTLAWRSQLYFYGPNQERFAVSPWTSNVEDDNEQPRNHAALITLRDGQNRVVREYTLDFNPTRWKLKRDYVYANKAGFYSYDYETEEGSIHHQDELGNVVTISDTLAGNQIKTFEYWPFGEEFDPPVDPEEFRHKFTGHERDFPDQDYMHARYYKPGYGRFLTLDPGPNELDNPQTWNRYNYSNNNPVRFVDPNGEVPVDTILDGISLGFNLGRAGYKLLKGDTQGAKAAAVDAAWDAAAFVVPYANGTVVKGGGKLAKQLFSKGDDVADASRDVSRTVDSTVDTNRRSPTSGNTSGDLSPPNPAAQEPNRIYSARELNRRTDNPKRNNVPNPNHNFPESFNQQIFKGEKTIVSDSYHLYTKRGHLNGKSGVFEIGVRPSASGRNEVITHRFFRPDKKKD